jgi:hypothetical protein
MSKLIAYSRDILIGAAVGIPAGIAGVWCINHLAALLIVLNGAA